MKDNNRKGELQYHVSQEAEMPSYMTVSICFVKYNIPQIFKLTWYLFVLYYRFI